MPRYTIHPSDAKLLEKDDIEKFINGTNREDLKFLITFLWLTGVRPAELKEMRREHIEINDSSVILRIPTLKLGEAQNFTLRERTLKFARPSGLETNWQLERVIEYLKTLPPEAPLCRFTKRWLEIQIKKIGIRVFGIPYTPYHIRHSAITREARTHNLSELMHFKGSKSAKSVEAYLHAYPYEVKI